MEYSKLMYVILIIIATLSAGTIREPGGPSLPPTTPELCPTTELLVMSFPGICLIKTREKRFFHYFL